MKFIIPVLFVVLSIGAAANAESISCSVVPFVVSEDGITQSQAQISLTAEVVQFPERNRFAKCADTEIDSQRVSLCAEQSNIIGVYAVSVHQWADRIKVDPMVVNKMGVLRGENGRMYILFTRGALLESTAEKLKKADPKAVVHHFGGGPASFIQTVLNAKSAGLMKSGDIVTYNTFACRLIK